MKLGHFLIPYTKTNSKWIKDLNEGPENISLLIQNQAVITTVSLINIFIGIFLQARETKAKINYWDYQKKKKNFFD